MKVEERNDTKHIIRTVRTSLIEFIGAQTNRKHKQTEVFIQLILQMRG